MAYSWCSIARTATEFPRFFRSLKMHFLAGRRGLLSGGALPRLPSGSSYRSLFCMSSPWMLLPPEFDGADKSRYCFFYMKEKQVIFKIKEKQVTELEKRSRSKVQEDEEEDMLTPDDDARCVGSSHGWLALINPSDCALYLCYPFSGRIIPLPPIQTLPCMLSLGEQQQKQLFEKRAPQEWSQFIIKKLILSTYPMYSGCIVMIIDGYDQKLAFCRPGDPTWTALDGAFDEYEEIAYSFKEKIFYALSVKDEFEAWDLRDLSSPKRCPMDEIGAQLAKYPTPAISEDKKEIKEDYCSYRGYLVVDPHSGALLYIRRFFSQIGDDGSIGLGGEFCLHRFQTLDFDVYKLDLKDKVLKCVDSLDDWAVFIGLNHYLIVCTRDFPEFKPNSIYFTDDITPLDNPYRGRDMGVYNLRDDNIKSCFPRELMKKIRSPTVWFNPSNVYSAVTPSKLIPWDPWSEQNPWWSQQIPRS